MDIVIPARIRLVDVIGEPARQGEFLFVPVLFDNTEWMYSSEEYALYAAVGERCLVEPDVWYGDTDRPQFLGLWVRARLPIVFGFAPPVEPGQDDRLLECPFLAVIDHGDRCELVAFVLSDFGLNPELEFFRDTDSGVAARVAAAFWGLLLAEPDALASFRAELLMEYDQDGICRVQVGFWGGRFRVYYSIDPLTGQTM